MLCGECEKCVVRKKYIDTLPDGNDYEYAKIETWTEEDKEIPFCIFQSGVIDPKKDCCKPENKRFAIKKGDK